MPIHPVSIVIASTLAVIGSGYAFKKFIYDPHLAPYVEAILDGQPIPSRAEVAAQRQQHRAGPIAIPISARSSAIRGPPITLRRRSRGSDSREYELRETLLPKSQGWEKTFELSRAGTVRSPPRELATLRGGADGADENTFRRQRKMSDPLIDLGPHDAEIKDVIFNYAPSRPASSTSYRIPQASSANPFISPAEYRADPGAPVLLPPMESTTFSFLSLSQISSPDVPTRNMTGSWTSAAAASPRGRDLPMRSGHTPARSISKTLGSPSRSPAAPWSPPNVRRDDDIMSISEGPNSMSASMISGFGDAEAYSHDSRALPQEGSNGLGLTAAGVALASWPSGGDRGLTRGPMSVVSLSESEGWRSDDNWDIHSEAERV